MTNNTNTTEKPAQIKAMNVDGQAIAELLPLAILIIIANGLVLVLFARRRQLRTPPNYVLFSLAVCDLLSGVINIPLFIVVGFTPVIKSLKWQRYLNFLVGVLNNLTAISACYHILAATTEKYLSIIWPVKHRAVNQKTAFKALEVIWAVSVVVAFIPFSWVNMGDRETRAILSLGHVIFCLFAVFLLPYSFMIYAFVVIFKKISGSSKFKGNASSRSHFIRQASLEKRCLMLFAAMATIFLVCWLPWFILMLLHTLKIYDLEVPSHVFVLVRYTTSIINPALYTFFRRDFKTALKSLLRKKQSRYCCYRFSRARKHDGTTANLTDEMAETAI